MPTYEAKCDACMRPFDYVETIQCRDLVPDCPHCGSKHTYREYRTAAPAFMDKDFSSENGGRGRFVDALAKVNPDGNTYDQHDLNAYCTSQRQALEKAKKLGLTAEKV